MEEKIVNDEIPPLGLEDGQDPQSDELLVVPPEMTNQEIRASFLNLAYDITAQANRDVGPKMNALESTMASRFRNFVMNPLIFLVL